jgi:hypothetical protein
MFLSSVLASAQPSVQETDKQGSSLKNNQDFVNDLTGNALDPVITSPYAISVDEKPIKRGDMIIGGGASLGFDNQRYTSGTLTNIYNTFNFGVSPRVLFFIVDRLALGAHVNFGFGLTNNSFSYYTGIGPELRYYTNTGLFLKTGLSYLYSHYETFNLNSLNITPGIGFAIFLNNNIALEPILTYDLDLEFRNSEISSNSTNTTHHVGVGLGLTIFL